MQHQILIQSHLQKEQSDTYMFHFHMKSLNQYSFPLFFSATALISSALCFTAEFKKSKVHSNTFHLLPSLLSNFHINYSFSFFFHKKNDLRFNEKLCHLPQSSVFGLGIAALISLTLSQIIGTFFICRKLHSSHNKSTAIKRLSISCILMAFSW